MEAVLSLDEKRLHSQLEQAHERLDGLVRKLRAVDRELDSLSGEREQHRLLHEVCEGLARLGELGGASLFWGEGAVDFEVSNRILGARGRIDAFDKRIGAIEERREALVEQLEQEQDGAEFLEDELREAEEAEEQRRHEWTIEREPDVLPVRELVMPWTRGGEEDQRFRKSLASSLLAALLLAVLHPLIELPLPELEPPIEVPERLTHLIPEAPRTPPPVAQREPKPEKLKPEPRDKSLVAEQPTAKRGPENAPEQAPGAKGILAFRERFSGLAANQPVANLGLEARINHAGEVASGAPERSLVTRQAPGSSGGVNLSALSRGTGGGGQQLEGVEVARATSAIAAIGDGAGGSGRPVGGDGPGLARTDEEIQIVFDRHKAALYRLYNRELRSDPTLQGQMVLRLRIEPDGSVSLCVLHGSDMDAPQLSAQVVERVKTFDFGAKDGIPAITILYPIDFLPAT
ncbi:MAG: AgmX/PglI C-terminal domain-containing protein [Myxococcota bacterium]